MAEIELIYGCFILLPNILGVNRSMGRATEPRTFFPHVCGGASQVQSSRGLAKEFEEEERGLRFCPNPGTLPVCPDEPKGKSRPALGNVPTLRGSEGHAFLLILHPARGWPHWLGEIFEENAPWKKTWKRCLRKRLGQLLFRNPLSKEKNSCVFSLNCLCSLNISAVKQHPSSNSEQWTDNREQAAARSPPVRSLHSIHTFSLSNYEGGVSIA